MSQDNLSPEPFESQLRYMHPALVSDEVLSGHLQERYAAPEIPPCRVCGARLAIAAMGGGNATIYRCSEAKLPDGKTDWDHYSRSEHRDARQGGDSRVIELVKRYEYAIRLIAEHGLEVGGLPYNVHAAFEGFKAAAKAGETSGHARSRLLALVSQYSGEPPSPHLLAELRELADELAKEYPDVGKETRLSCEAHLSLRLECRASTEA